jgi:hypothetical protein
MVGSHAVGQSDFAGLFFLPVAAGSNWGPGRIDNGEFPFHYPPTGECHRRSIKGYASEHNRPNALSSSTIGVQIGPCKEWLVGKIQHSTESKDDGLGKNAQVPGQQGQAHGVDRRGKQRKFEHFCSTSSKCQLLLWQRHSVQPICADPEKRKSFPPCRENLTEE